MIDRGVAVVLTEDQLRAWTGDYYYLDLLGVKGKSGDIRVVFNAAKKQGG